MPTRFTTRVTIQSGVETRDASGGVHYDTFEDVAGMESIPAVLMPTVDEKYQERFDNDEDSWHIILAGHWPDILPKMYVLNEGVRYEVRRSSTTKRQRLTTLLARRGTL